MCSVCVVRASSILHVFFQVYTDEISSWLWMEADVDSMRRAISASVPLVVTCALDTSWREFHVRRWALRFRQGQGL
jgi:hypothetical protein